MPARFRGQIIPLVLVVVVILFPNFLYITGNNPMFPYDPTSLALVIVGLLFMIIMRRHKFLDVVPVAHNLVFKNVNSGVIILDERMHILEMNPAAEQILTCKQEEMMGKSVVGLFPEHKDLIMRTREVLELTTEIEMGSNMRIYELQTTPLTDHTGRPAGRIIMLYDITERRRALDELDAYAQTVAHDLKSPLSSLLGFAEFLKMKELPDKERERFLQAISDGASKMNDIVDGLLLLASVRNQEEVEISPLDMETIVSSAVSRLSDVVTEHGAQISQRDTWPVALGYAPWVEEIWVNYISNAIKYGGSPPIVKLGADWQDTAVHFWVKDNGRGLSEEEQATLFTEFTRLERHKDSIQGHGLGLSIVQRITRKLGGEVGVESNMGEGSTFYFKLPAATAQ
jgi:PAS domain S-box-containing protein